MKNYPYEKGDKVQLLKTVSGLGSINEVFIVHSLHYIEFVTNEMYEGLYQ